MAKTAMTKLEVYEKALTLFGKIFSQMKSREGRYFLGTLKFDFVFFLFALIWKENVNPTIRTHPNDRNEKARGRFFPHNFNEWAFSDRFISSKDNSPDFWDTDKNYFRQDKITKRTGENLAVLSYGLDLDKFSTLEELARKEKITAVIDWRGDLRDNSFEIIKKKRIFFSSLFYYFLFQNLTALIKIYRLLTKNCGTNLSWFGFLSYFLYYAFHSARIRYLLKLLHRDSAIGKVIFSDIDNAWGNSFMLWSRFYGFFQTTYTHGSSLYFNRHRFFEPDTYYVYTNYHKKVLSDLEIPSRVVLLQPKWLKKENATPINRNSGRTIAFITNMEKNIEVPLNEKETLLDYLENTSQFACQRDIALVVKSHKLLDWHTDYDNISKKFSCVEHIQKRWSMEDIAKIDIGILTVTETTLALQLLYLGIPVITCTEVAPIWTKHFSAPNLQFVVNSKKELLEILEKLTTDKEFYKKAQKEASQLFRSLVNGA